jgi:phosphoglycolate phosphatase-like HAD superfamily hydrolase
VLILFDIDGTLLMGTPRAHTEALAVAMADVYGVAVDVGDVVAVRPAGRTDQEIARLVLRGAGVADGVVTAGLADWMARAAEVYPRIDEAHPGPDVAPGAATALARVAEGPASVALLTGNLEPIAHAKMARAGLAPWFARGRGAFGSDHERRDALVPIAVGREPAPLPAVVVGDTPRDIACARAAGARCVAVTTGAYDAVALAGADAVVPGLEGAADVLERWAA